MKDKLENRSKEELIEIINDLKDHVEDLSDLILDYSDCLAISCNILDDVCPSEIPWEEEIILEYYELRKKSYS